MIEIHFHRSKSKNFRLVLKHASCFSDFSEGKVNILKTESAEIFRLWDDFNIVFHYCKSWSGTTIFDKGIPVVSDKQKSEWFYYLQDVKNCHKWYLKSYDKEGYCNDGGCWGCKRLNSIIRYQTPSFWDINYWYNYGSFVDIRTWKIDKKRIAAILEEEARIKKIDVCPAFLNTMKDEFINELPDYLLIDNFNWKIRYVSDFTKDGTTLVANGIEPVLKEQNIEEGFNEVEVLSTPKRSLSEDEWANDIIDKYLNSKNEGF